MNTTIFSILSFLYALIVSTFQDLSEAGNLEEFDRQEVNTTVGDDNSNDENDVDDETMSGTFSLIDLIIWSELSWCDSVKSEKYLAKLTASTLY